MPTPSSSMAANIVSRRLTGVFGEGEAGKVRQPPHPECEDFARLLLGRRARSERQPGALQPDVRALTIPAWNCCWNTDSPPPITNNWLVREDGGLVANSQTVFDYQLAWACEKRMERTVRLLVEHGADVNKPVNGRTPFEWARLRW